MVQLVDVASKSGSILTEEGRKAIEQWGLSGRSGIAANSMAWVFLASSFEEFYREMISQSAAQIFSNFPGMADEFRTTTRASYWDVCLQKLRFTQRITTKGKPVRIDSELLSKARVVIESAAKMVIGNDAEGVDEKLVAFHMNNFKPHVVDEIGRRIGVSSVIRSVSGTRDIKNIFPGKVNDVEIQLRAALTEFYDIRNEIVHSLSSAAGQGLSNVETRLSMFETFGRSIKSVLQGHLATLDAQAAA
ncbi:MAG TPA: HEPN domain-containing protein [Allosphingosinicella sp.]|nr:HEPN domain-containing protein [Allosphingosinicella sp.]